MKNKHLFFCGFQKQLTTRQKLKNIDHRSTWSMPHSSQNDGYICLYDPIYIPTSYLRSYQCQLTCNTLVLLHQVPQLLCPHLPPSLLCLPFFFFNFLLLFSCCCESLPVALLIYSCPYYFSFVLFCLLLLQLLTPLCSLYILTLYLCVCLVNMYICPFA